MKFTLLATALVVVYVFFPIYDLYVIKDPFSDEYSLERRGIYLEKNCLQQAQSLDKVSFGTLRYRCRKTSKWAGMRDNYTKYNLPAKDTQDPVRDD
jgi:hypothetical protein